MAAFQHGFTALHYASLNGHIKAVKMLIDNGAQVTIPSKVKNYMFVYLY